MGRIASLLPTGSSRLSALLLAVTASLCSDRVTEGWRILAYGEPAAMTVTLSAAMLLRFDVDLRGLVWTASSEGESAAPAYIHCLNGHMVIGIAPLLSANLRVDETKVGARERLLDTICTLALHCGQTHGHSKYSVNYMRGLMSGS